MSTDVDRLRGLQREWSLPRPHVIWKDIYYYSNNNNNNNNDNDNDDDDD